MIKHFISLRTLPKKILLDLPGVPIKVEFVTRYKKQDAVGSPCEADKKGNPAPKRCLTMIQRRHHGSVADYKKIVDCDVKPNHKQTLLFSVTEFQTDSVIGMK